MPTGSLKKSRVVKATKNKDYRRRHADPEPWSMISIKDTAAHSSNSALLCLDYATLMTRILSDSVEDTIAYLMRALPYAWRDAYQSTSARRTSIVRIQDSSFEYLYDNYSYLESTGAVPHDPVIEDRLVAVFGLSSPGARPQDDYRLRGWVGPDGKDLH